MTDVTGEQASSTGAPRTRSTLLSFLCIGALSYVIDAGLLVLISGPLDGPVWLAATVGFWTSVVVNFALNRTVFAREPDASTVATHTARYAALLAFNYLVTLAVVHVGVSWGLAPVVPKTAVVGLIMVWNFVLYRWWVFR